MLTEANTALCFFSETGVFSAMFENTADLGGCYPPPPSASVDNTLLDLQNSSYPTQPHSIIDKFLQYLIRLRRIIVN